MFENLSEITVGFFTNEKKEESREAIAQKGYTIVTEKDFTVLEEKGKLFTAVKLDEKEDIN